MPNYRSTQFGLRHRFVAFVSTRLFSGVTYTIRTGLATGMRRKGGLAFLPLRWSDTPETRFLTSLELTGKVVYDVGGFEGVLTMFFARRAARVITFEPNPRNYARCAHNVRINGLTNVRVLNRGLSSEAGQLEMLYDRLMPGAASANSDIRDQISSTATVQTALISVAPLDSEIETLDLPPPDFVKIDIEGMELQALQGMSRTLASRGPELYIELHGAEWRDKIANALAVVRLLEGAGYRAFDVENNKYVSSATLDSHPPSHLYCTRERH